MTAAELIRRKQQLVDRYGEWTAHNIHLGHGVYTIAAPVVGDNESRLRRIVQICADLARVPFAKLRVADLGALEGGFAVEFASQGAQVVAVEGREPSIEKARFAKEALGLDQLELVNDDVRNFDRHRFGRFDIVLAVGLVYHLDVPELVDFLAKVRTCTRMTVIDSEIAAEREATLGFERDGSAYRGVRYEEPTGAALDRDVLWSSLGNRHSFKPTRAALLNGLLESGFTSVFECHVPPVTDERAERATLVAISGSPQAFATSPALNEARSGQVPDFDLVLSDRSPDLPRHRIRSLRAPMKRRLKQLLRRP